MLSSFQPACCLYITRLIHNPIKLPQEEPTVNIMVKSMKINLQVTLTHLQYLYIFYINWRCVHFDVKTTVVYRSYVIQ